MRQANRLISNVLLLQGRMLLTVGLGVLTTRLLLQALGAEGFGFWTAVLAFTGLLGFAAEGMRTTCNRMLAVAVGQSRKKNANQGLLHRAVGTNLVVLLGLCAIVITLAAAATPIVLHLLEVPEGREWLTPWFYFAAVLNTVAVFLAIAPIGLMTAHQDLHLIASRELIESVGRFLIALSLPWLPADPLVVYVVATVMLSVVMTASLFTAAWALYPQARVRTLRPDPEHFEHLRGFAAWSLVGSGGTLVLYRGGAIVLNNAFGPVANASLSVAVQLIGLANSLVASLRKAIEPALTVHSAEGTQRNVVFLATVASKYSVTLSAPLLLLLTIQAKPLLRLWLMDVPENAIVLTRYLAAAGLLSFHTVGHNLANNADGRIRGANLATAGCALAAFAALACAVYLFSLGPETFGAAAFAYILGVNAYRVMVIGPRIGLTWSAWGSNVLARTVPIEIILAFVYITLLPWSTGNAWRCVLLFLLGGVITMGSAWALVLDAEERFRYRSFFATATARLRRRRLDRSK